MNKKYSVATVLVGILMLVAGFIGTAQAAQKKGDRDVRFAGSYFHAQGVDSGTLTGDIGYGYYITDNIELGVLQTVGYSFIDDADDQWVASTIPFVNYYFRGLSEGDTFQPFLGAFVGASYNENDATGTLGPQIGFKSYISDSTYFVVRYRYEWFFEELALNEVEDTSSDGNHVVTFGVGFLF